jgi:hypothetical protein
MRANVMPSCPPLRTAHAHIFCSCMENVHAEFRKMFTEYMDEISNPEHRKVGLPFHASQHLSPFCAMWLEARSCQCQSRSLCGQPKCVCRSKKCTFDLSNKMARSRKESSSFIPTKVFLFLLLSRVLPCSSLLSCHVSVLCSMNILREVLPFV